MAKTIFRFNVPKKIQDACKMSGHPVVSSFGVRILTEEDDLTAIEMARGNSLKYVKQCTMRCLAEVNTAPVKLGDENPPDVVYASWHPRMQHLLNAAYIKTHGNETSEMEDFFSSMSVVAG